MCVCVCVHRLVFCNGYCDCVIVTVCMYVNLMFYMCVFAYTRKHMLVCLCVRVSERGYECVYVCVRTLVVFAFLFSVFMNIYMF